MVIDWKKIYEGWRNQIIPPKELKELIEKTGTIRMDVCRKCEHNSKNFTGKTYRFDEHCMKCGCTLSAKTKCLSCKCPLPSPKWDAVITLSQEEEIKKEIKDG